MISLVTYNDDKNGNHKYVFDENSVSVDCDNVAYTFTRFDHDNVKLLNNFQLLLPLQALFNDLDFNTQINK